MAASVESLGGAWSTVTAGLLPCRGQTKAPPTDAVLKSAIAVLDHHGVTFIIEEWFLDSLQADLRENIGPAFWNHFSSESNGPKQHGADGTLVTAFRELHASLSSYLPSVDVLERLRQEGAKQRLKDKVLLIFKALLFYDIPLKFHGVVKEFYSCAFKACEEELRKKEKASPGEDGPEEEEEDGDEDSLTCGGCEHDKEHCTCTETLTLFHQLNSQLHSLGLLERVCGEAVTAIIHDRIQQHIQNTCQGEFESQFLLPLEKWLNSKVLSWLHLVFKGTPGQTGEREVSAKTQESLDRWQTRLLYFLYQTYGTLRISEMFDIIVEFPDSMSALEDLKVCLEKTDLRQTLVSSLRSAIGRRLLQPGATTSDVLSQYILLVKSLRVLDPTGVLLELVGDRIRHYLRTRDDTVRKIVEGLTEEEGGSDLADELMKGDPISLEEGVEEEGGDPWAWNKWEPDPIDADPSKTSKSRRSPDIISLLISIYGSKELFIKEYQSVLCNRILSFNYDLTRELRNLELLKLRFGESQLGNCEVMLKDVQDSKRVNDLIKSENLMEQGVAVSGMIISAQYWPQLKETKLALPPAVQQRFDSYTQAFQTVKASRTLNWLPQMGLVDLDIELKNRRLSVMVNPVVATIIMHFQDKERWTLDELSTAMQVPSSVLRRRITFWQNYGLIRENPPGSYVLLEEGADHHGDVMIDSDEETESATASSQEMREEEMQMFWVYVQGMLTNLDSLPLERIHSMLKMFAMRDNPIEISLPELKAFLDSKVRSQQLLLSGGKYKLPKNR
ncbi:ANAPC2 [Branchiostoma lanceolatum]|uniref:Anaphase-promoting complex subunit 2 n=1 Tax=Branchiostoma lanceolatum TaxID=7740 RepID=A0A8K0AC87_BRALA|nr:ANAPC2 [Branchiostoma lanceolatum]